MIASFCVALLALEWWSGERVTFEAGRAAADVDVGAAPLLTLFAATLLLSQLTAWALAWAVRMAVPGAKKWM